MIRLASIALSAAVLAAVPQSSHSQPADSATTAAQGGIAVPPAKMVGKGQQDQPGELGMPAPPLQVAEWVKGTSVSLEQGRGEKITVVEFWATWCPPCRTSIPHLTELQKQYGDKGVTIVGITSEDADKVKPFVEKQGAEMDYTVAIDDNDMTSRDYMKAFGVRGIPHAFVVDKSGAIAWHGHPMMGLDSAIEEMLAGTYDIEKAKRELNAEKLVEQYLTLAAEGDPKARDVGEQAVKDAGSNGGLLNEMAWSILTSPKIEKRDLELAERAAKAAVDATKGESASILDTYARAQFDGGKVKEAVETQQKAVAAASTDKEREELGKSLEKYQAAEKK